MTEFLELLPPREARDILLARLPVTVRGEEVESWEALGRVTAEAIRAEHPLPDFPRSTVDGYAVLAKDTYGASESLPAYLTLRGEAPMGSTPAFRIQPGYCALIHTGGMLPNGADAVVMVEHTQQAREKEVEVLRPVGVGENVIRVGEDVAAGDIVIPTGVFLRPAEIGGLAALGKTTITVSRQPSVGIISSGDEVVPADQPVKPGQVRDVNAHTLRSLVQSAGGIPKGYGIARDTEEDLFAKASLAVEENDLVIITAGSSLSTRDLTATVINRLGDPGVLVHGVNVRPGKPTILGICSGKAVIGLPGNPVSALVIATLFVVPIIKALQGLEQPRPHPQVRARLGLNLSSQSGREDWVSVRLVPTQEPPGYVAEPIFGKSNLIFTLVRADGLLKIPADANGLRAGAEVEVYLL